MPLVLRWKTNTRQERYSHYTTHYITVERDMSNVHYTLPKDRLYYELGQSDDFTENYHQSHCYNVTYHICFLREDAVIDTLWSHPLDGEFDL